MSVYCASINKTRSLAAEAIRGGHVRMNDAPCKPAREVRAGDTVVARVAMMTRTVRAIAAPKSRVAAKLVPEFAEDLTPPEEYARGPEPGMPPPIFRPHGSGRPTKRDRREMDRLGEAD